MRRAPTLATVVALATFGGPLHAETGNPFGWHEHDGFYLRLGSGPSSVNLNRSTEHSGSGGTVSYQGDESTVEGLAVGSEVSIGATPFESVVIAGSWLVHLLPSAALDLADGSSVELDSSLGFVWIGPTVDIFPKPAGGFHLGGGVGFAAVTATVPDVLFDSIGGSGAGVTAAVGYDLWVDDDWSLGVLGRGTLALLGSEQQEGGVTGSERDTITVFGITLSALYH
jgi:hypothetical protein